MSTELHALTSGTRGLEFGYTLMLLAMLTGLYHARASLGKFLVSPLAAGVMTLFSGIVIAITSSPLRLIGISNDGILQFLFGLSMLVAMGYVAGRVLAAHNGQSSLEHRRGAMVNPAPPASSESNGRPSRGRTGGTSAGITIANVPIPLEDETKHFKIIGTTGTGKSTAIREMLTGALGRGDRAIIADPDGGYASRFYDPDRGDIILNPFHSDGRKWDPFGEVVNNYDIDQLARSLIPDSGDPDRIWAEYGRTFFGAVMRQQMRFSDPSDRELFRLLTSAGEGELRTMLGGTAAAPFLDVGNEKMFGCVRSVVGSAVKVIEYIVEQQAAPFSVRQWVREGSAKHAGGPGGVLFIPYTAGEIAALRSVISAWMRLGIFESMDRAEGDQRLWFIIDELDALGEIDGLKDALARVRKFGGRGLVGLQSISQVSGTYGKGVAETIVENCSNTAILRSSASEHGGTSEFASKLIGQREVMHTTTSRTRRGRWDWRSSITTSQQIRTEYAVMASEIERLPDLTGFLKLASIPDWQVITLTRANESTKSAAWRPSRTACPPAPPAAPSAPAASVPPVMPPSSPVTPSTPEVAPASPAAANRKGNPRAGKPRASSTPRRPRQPKAVPQPAARYAPVQNRPDGGESKQQLP